MPLVNSPLSQKPHVMIVMNENGIFMVDIANMTVESDPHRMPDFIDTTTLHSRWSEYSIGFGRKSVSADVVGELKWHALEPGSDGWMKLCHLAMEESVRRQVSEAMSGAFGSFSSEFGNAIKRVEERAASALSSLAEAEDASMKALRRRSERAKKHISTSAHGFAKSLQKAPSKKASPKGPAKKAQRAVFKTAKGKVVRITRRTKK